MRKTGRVRKYFCRGQNRTDVEQQKNQCRSFKNCYLTAAQIHSDETKGVNEKAS
jgi:hypothetical protein